LPIGLDKIISSKWRSSAHDFNGDGFSDILWRDTSGNLSMWFMNGLQVSSAVPVGQVPIAWNVQSLNSAIPSQRRSGCLRPLSLAAAEGPLRHPNGPRTRYGGRYQPEAAATFDPNMTKRLQAELNKFLSPSPNLTVDGFYGPKTREAVEAAQRKLKITVDGWAGKVTQAAIQSALAKVSPH
jgi:Putative peptidoglycan binding domain